MRKLFIHHMQQQQQKNKIKKKETLFKSLSTESTCFAADGIMDGTDGGGIYSNVAADILPLLGHKGSRHTGEHGEPIRAGTVQEERNGRRERLALVGCCADAAERIARVERAPRLASDGWLAGRSVGRGR